MKKTLAFALVLALMLGMLAGCGSSTTEETATSESTSTETTAETSAETSEESSATTESESNTEAASDLNVAVFYYTYSDVYITSVRSELDAQLDALGVTYTDYDGNNTQSTQLDQVNTAITNGANLLIVNIVETSSHDAAQNVVNAAQEKDIPVIFFNREVSDDVVNSYDKCAFVGTDAAEAGHLQGEMIADYLIENYDAVDLNGDGRISYVMFKGQEGNNEAEYRTQYSVEDANSLLAEAGYGSEDEPALTYYAGDDAATKYQVDPNGSWSSAAATNYMDTILAEYSESNGNMVELVICNNDDMAMGAISSLQTAGYNLGDGSSTTIPVFGVDAVDNAKAAIAAGTMTGTVMQDAVGMASSIATLVTNFSNDGDLMSDTGDMIVDEGVAKIRVPYAAYFGE